MVNPIFPKALCSLQVEVSKTWRHSCQLDLSGNRWEAWGKELNKPFFFFSIYLFFVQWAPVLLGDDHQLTGLIHKVYKTHIESLCEQFLSFAMALEIPQWLLWYNRTTMCPYPWKGMSTGPGGLATLHITERGNYLQTPDSGGLFFAFSGAVHGLRKRIAQTFLKTCRKTLNSPNLGQQEQALLYRLESRLSRQSLCFCRGPGLGSQHLDGDFETAFNSSSKVPNVLFLTSVDTRHPCYA